MYLKLARTDTWSEVRITLQDSHQKDYDYFENGNIEVFVYGYPYHEARITWFSASDLHETYLKDGTEFADDIEGCYTIVILDKTRQRCLIVTDRYGIYSLFYSRRQDAITISDSVTEIVSDISHVRLNQTSIVEYLNCGLVFGAKTHIQEVNRFSPATIHTISNDLTLSERTYWEYSSAGGAKISNEEFLHLFNNHVSAGLQLEERVSMPLTGGLDSRTALSACLSARKRMHCYTHGLQSSADVRIAKKISQTLNIPHDVYTLSDEWIRSIPSLVAGKAAVFDGLVDFIRYLYLENSYVKERDKSELFLSGVGGEMLRAYYAPRNLSGSGLLHDVAAALRSRMQLGQVLDVYAGLDGEQVSQLLGESVRQELTKAKTEDTVTMSEHFYLYNRIANFMSCSLMLAGKYLKIFNPFLSGKLLKAIPFLDPQEKMSGAIPTHIISSNSPTLKRTLLDSGRCIDQNDLQMRFRSYVATAAIYFRGGSNLISRRLSRSNIFPIQYFVDYASWLRSYHREYVREVLDHDQMTLKDFFDRQRLERTVSSFLAGRTDLSPFVTGLMSLESWARRVLAR